MLFNMGQKTDLLGIVLAVYDTVGGFTGPPNDQQKSYPTDEGWK